MLENKSLNDGRILLSYSPPPPHKKEKKIKQNKITAHATLTLYLIAITVTNLMNFETKLYNLIL